jgi:hypothetical protein
MGKLLEMPSPEDRERVSQLARIGASEETIAAELQIPRKRLKKQFRRELKQGEARGKHQILENFYEAAASGSNNAATTFWVKSRCGWRDTGAPAEPPQIIKPILRILAGPGAAAERRPHEPGIAPQV